MKFSGKLLLVTIFLLFSVCSMAGLWSQETTFYIYGNFSGYAYGKDVDGVYFHTGILKNSNTCGNSGKYYWESVQHIPMKRIGDHFFIKTKVTSQTSECSAKNEGPIVQYWVRFKDGTQIQTNSFMIQTTGMNLQNTSSYDYKVKVAERDQIYYSLNDSQSTRAEAVSYSFQD